MPALAIGIGVTGVALLESWRGWPYAPFLLVHATLAVLIPLLCRGWPTGRPARELRRLLPGQVGPMAAATAFIAFFVLAYTTLLAATSRTGDPAWDLTATYRGLMAAYVERHGRVETIVLGYLLLGIWPMFGEELFYRGLVLRGLLDGMRPAAAVAVSSVLFGLRHSAQLGYFMPDYPVGSAIAYFSWAFGLSVILGWIYVRTCSLWVCMALHSVNIVLAPFAIQVLLA